MALFDKKSAYEKVLEAYKSLSDEDKQKVHDEIMDVNKAEDEREIDKIEEDKADNTETKDDKAEEVKEESEEVGEDIDKAEGEEETEETEEPDGENVSEVIKALSARMDAYDEKLSYLDELSNKLESYNKDVEKEFGLEAKGAGDKSNDDTEMSYGDLKRKVLGGN